MISCLNSGSLGLKAEQWDLIWLPVDVLLSESSRTNYMSLLFLTQSLIHPTEKDA